MSSLNPNDRLDRDLYVEALLNPDLFFAIEQEFGLKTNVMDWSSHEPEVRELVTFRNLVDFVEGKLLVQDDLPNQRLHLTGGPRE